MNTRTPLFCQEKISGRTSMSADFCLLKYTFNQCHQNGRKQIKRPAWSHSIQNCTANATTITQTKSKKILGLRTPSSWDYNERLLGSRGNMLGLIHKTENEQICPWSALKGSANEGTGTKREHGEKSRGWFAALLCHIYKKRTGGKQLWCWASDKLSSPIFTRLLARLPPPRGKYMSIKLLNAIDNVFFLPSFSGSKRGSQGKK